MKEKQAVRKIKRMVEHRKAEMADAVARSMSVIKKLDSMTKAAQG